MHGEHDARLPFPPRLVEGVKKTAISQAKSSIASEHTRNTCDFSYAAPLEIERERERKREKEGEGGNERGRGRGSRRDRKYRLDILFG